MAQITFTLPDDLVLGLRRLDEQYHTNMAKVVKAGSDAVFPTYKVNLESAIGKNVKRKRSTGELVHALGISPVKVSHSGYLNAKIGFAEPRRGNGSANALAANVLEHGKANQPARKFEEKTRRQVKNLVKNAMIDRFNSLTSNLND